MEYIVVHDILGRVRIKIPRLSYDHNYAARLCHLISSLQYVTTLRINLTALSMIITYETSKAKTPIIHAEIFAAIERANDTRLASGKISDSIKRENEYFSLMRLGLPIFALVLALLEGPLSLTLSPLLVGILVLLSIIPILSMAISRATKEKQLSIETLDSLWSILQAFEGQFIAPSLNITLDETRRMLGDTITQSPQYLNFDFVEEHTVWIEIDKVEHKVPISAIQEGSLLVAYPGDVIPICGKVVQGHGLINVQRLTGESTLVHCQECHEILANTFLIEGKLWILVQEVKFDTQFTSRVRLLDKVSAEGTRIEKYAKEIEKKLILPTLAFGAFILTITGDLSRALAPLQLDLGSGLGLSAPNTVFSALAYAAQQGIYVRCGRVLETLAYVDAIVFDKTGTLTQRKPLIINIQVCSEGISSREILKLAASTQQGLNHPLSKAIMEYAIENNIDILSTNRWEYRTGMGILAYINKDRVVVGSKKHLEQEGINIPYNYLSYDNQNSDICNEHSEHDSAKFSYIFVAKNAQLLGYIKYFDPIRSEAELVIQYFQNLNIEIYLVTGDLEQTANYIAEKIGIKQSNIYAEADSSLKVEIIRNLKQIGKTVIYIGDSISDYDALCSADISISITEANDLIRETADIVLMNNDLKRLIYTFEIAKEALQIINQNAAIVAAPNLCLVLAGIVFAFDPVAVVIFNYAANSLAELNSLYHFPR